jgi:hypothetical protein
MKTRNYPLVPQNADDVIENYETQPRCRATLKQRDIDKFDGPTTLEDGEPCNVTAVFDDDHLHVDVYALNSSWHQRVTLRRNHDPDSSDFTGVFGVEERRYQVGVYVLRSRLELRIYFRPLHLHSTPGGTTLEVVVR